ncbi:ribonuclease HII [Pontibacter anaerobius]|uniref:Ribonuclease HII n=1 Tax=Pontibacter anaerobius TaxID=2993940 RepID=A0ABT3RBD7_9BACT|nr:ribonuclease HII [Pontibacter anaerobius]MCX2738759.1 ribonuclease HII [Pontibacter anaerobius]
MLLPNHSGYTLEAGVDEVGRGCLAGPVVAAAVILPHDYQHPLLNDSKKLTKRLREQLRGEITRDAVAWAIGEASPEEIDKVNILNATYLAMHRALEALRQQPEYLLVDGNRFKPYGQLPYSCMVKGDARFLSIAAASVLAKTYRDELMCRLAEEHPYFGWEQNAGYPTKAHRAGISKYGVTPYHRQSFALLPKQLELL